MLKVKTYIFVAILVLLPAAPQSYARKLQKHQEPTEEEVRQERELKYFFYEAMRTMDDNRFDETLALLRHCFLLSPNDAATNYYLGVLYGGMHNDQLMLQHIDRAYAVAPQDYWYVYAVQHYKASGEKRAERRGSRADDRKQAINALKKEIRRSPHDSHAAEVLQNIYMREDNARGALQMQDIIDRINGVDTYNAIKRYRLYMMAGKTKQATAVINRYLQHDPDDYYMQVFLGDVMMQQGDREEAYEQYLSVEKNYPENPYLNVSLSNYYGETGDYYKAAFYQLQALNNGNIPLDYKLNLLRDSHWLTHNDSLHLEALHSLISQYPLDEEAYQPLTDYYISTDSLQQAKTLLRTLLDINPDNSQTWKTLLSLYQQDSTTTTDDYLQLTRRAITHQPDEQQWYFIMSSLQMQKEQADSAIYFCKEGLSRPDPTDLHYKIGLLVQLADIYVREEQYDSAFHYYEEALTYNPENAYVLNNYAYVLATQGGDLRKAEKMSQRTIKAEPNNATFLDTYAWILHLSGQEQLARFYMQQAWNNTEDKTDPEMLEHYQIILQER